MITTQHCAECERLALLDDLHKGLKKVYEQQESETVCEEQKWLNGIVEKGYWNMIYDLQRHQHAHTCGGKR